MVNETWTTEAVPLLEAVLAGEIHDPGAVTSELLRRCNLEPTTQRTLAALVEDEYLVGAGVHWPIGRPQPVIVADILRLTPKGRRAVGQWPEGSTGDLLRGALEAALIELPEGEAKSKVRALLDATRQVGTDVLSAIVSNVVRSSMGLP